MDHKPAQTNFPIGAQEMPRYRSHKTVRALKITGIDFHANGADLSADGFDPWAVNAEYVRINPALGVGGYYVSYEGDHYASYSPAKAFEEGYTLIDGKADQKKQIPRFGSGTSFHDRTIAADLDGVLWLVDVHLGVYAGPVQPYRKQADDGPHCIGWAVKQMHNGAKVRRGWWEKHEVVKIGGAGFHNESDKSYLMSSEDVLAIDWEIAT